MHYGINFHHNLAKFRPAISTQSNNPIHTIITSTYCITVLHLSIEEAFIEPSTYHDWFKSVLWSISSRVRLSYLLIKRVFWGGWRSNWFQVTDSHSVDVETLRRKSVESPARWDHYNAINNYIIMYERMYEHFQKNCNQLVKIQGDQKQL